MTTVAFAALQRGLTLTTAPIVYIVGAANTQAVIKRAVFTNTTGGSVTLTAWRVPFGGAAIVGNMIISARPIAAHGTDLAPELANMTLTGGDMIMCQASANAAINVFASGLVVS